MSDEMKSLAIVYSPSGPGTVGFAGKQTPKQKWYRFLIALLFLLSPSGAFAQQTSAKVQTSDKAAWVGNGDGNKKTDSVAPTDPNYLIGPQDTLDIAVWKEPDLTRTVPVRPDGKISLPLLDDVQAGGLTPSQLGVEITQRLKKYLTDPRVTVIVTTIASQRVYILGEVTRAGAYPLISGMTLLQALSSAGGFTQFANPRNIYLLREENGKQVKHPFNYRSVVSGKNSDQNVVLKAGDTIVVP
ncbi:MAG TPA: polysaccharide biosynthesis/export family protein [Candidatus Acidoferrum sp.]|nr:polysaccharide biosynthesis/export family protein [Candidatus Acidoferrum sp.]